MSTSTVDAAGCRRVNLAEVVARTREAVRQADEATAVAAERDRPRVVVHSMASVDGRLDGFAPDLGLYYRLAAAVPHEAVLTGSGTLVAAAAEQGIDLAEEDPLPVAAPPEPHIAQERRPWLVAVDSRGRLTRFAWLREQPHWRDVLVLCTSATDRRHRERLSRHGVTSLEVGDERVNLGAALRELTARYRVRNVRVDAGGTLVTALLRAGLVDEISVVVAPYLVGTGGGRPLRLVEELPAGGPRLIPTAVAELPGCHLWLRYAVAPADPRRAGRR